MTAGFDRAYAYARACGSLSRSFLGERAAAIARATRVAGAWRLVFDDPPPELPESALSREAEVRLDDRAPAAVAALGGEELLETPLFRALARRAEGAYLKRVIAAALLGRPLPQSSGPSSRFPDLSLEAFPDIDRVVRGGAFGWIAETGSLDLPTIKNGIDRSFFRGLWDAARDLPPRVGGCVPGLVRAEAEIVNVVWAQRLARSRAMGADDIRARLADLPGTDATTAAISAVAFRADARADWRGWKWERLVPDVRKDGAWRLDLGSLEAAADAWLLRRLARALHMGSDTIAPLYALYRIKEIETATLRGVIEGIKLEVPVDEIVAFASARGGGGA